MEEGYSRERLDSLLENFSKGTRRDMNYFIDIESPFLITLRVLKEFPRFINSIDKILWKQTWKQIAEGQGIGAFCESDETFGKIIHGVDYDKVSMGFASLDNLSNQYQQAIDSYNEFIADPEIAIRQNILNKIIAGE
jgi:hypothetical protein